MRCDEAQQALSASFDGEALPAGAVTAVAEHRDACGDCQRFEREVAALRQQLRFEVVEHVPDVAGRVAAAVGTRRPAVPAGLRETDRPAPGRARRAPGWLRVAAAFVAGAVVGGAVLWQDRTGPRGVAAADLPERIVAAQQHVRSLTARVEIVERGWHPDVTTRTFSGELTYAAPESMALVLSDETDYPSPAWVPDDAALVVDGDTLWRKGPRRCPAESQPGCTPPAPEVEVVQNREPFADGSPVPLELVTPVDSFALAGTPATVPGRRIAGRDALGLSVTAGQVAPLLAGLRPAGNLREVHPLDPVELWLDRDTYVPLALRVVAADRPERARWAAARRYQERPGAVVLEWRLSDVRVNGDVPAGAFGDPPFGGRVVDSGFVDGPTAAPSPDRLPAGLVPHRAGRVGTPASPIEVRTWTDGRAWVKVRATTGWPGGRLFGDLGAIVRAVDLGAAGVGYTSEDGSRIAIHGDGIDVVVMGSLPPAVLRTVAASLDIVGRAVPAGWDEAATATLEEARAAVDGLLAPPPLPGFGPPAVRIEGGQVSMSYAGPGDRGFLLVQLPDGTFTPPVDPDAQGVAVRGREGRYSPSRGELEWGENDGVVSLRSTTLSLPELLAIAEGLVRS